jgi:GntR family transcriptional regulator, carbon starvation induced regulator
MKPQPAIGTSAEKATTATLVYQRLRTDILKGVLKPGQKLQIDAIAARYEAGTNPVREALNRLTSERLVDRKDQRGFFVPEIHIEDFRDLVKTRCWIEGKALDESVANRTQQWEDTLILAFHRLAATPIRLPEEGGDNSEWEARHRAFHNALIAACGSLWIIRMCNEMMDHAERYRYISMVKSYPRRDSVAEHSRIMEAAIRGDAEKAKAELVEHYMLTLELTDQQFMEGAGTSA